MLVDYNSKAFDCVKCGKLWLVMENMEVLKHIILLIKNLYEHSYGKVKTNNVVSKSFRPKSGVRQGCIVSPILFNIYGEYIIRKVMHGWKGGITIGGRKITNLIYADDPLILAGSAEELVQIMSKLDTISKEYGYYVEQKEDPNHDSRPSASQHQKDC